MSVWSSLRAISRNVLSGSRNLSVSSTARSGGHSREFRIKPSSWQWHKFKDMLHYYTMVGLIPVGLVIFGSNVFIGPATLTPIPEDYTPKYWEYARHPITRFIARYIMTSPQQEYEKYCHFLYEEKQKMLLREIEDKVITRMRDHADYQAYYYRPVTAKYIRAHKEECDDMRARVGDN